LQESQGREAFFSRLHALAAAQDLIIDSAGRGALMKDIVGKALETDAGYCFDQKFSQPQCRQVWFHHARIGNQRCQTRRNDNRQRHSFSAMVIDATSLEPAILFQWKEWWSISHASVTQGLRHCSARARWQPQASPILTIAEGFTYEVRAALAQPRPSEVQLTDIGQPIRMSLCP
jgi:hypothetical protein